MILSRRIALSFLPVLCVVLVLALVATGQPEGAAKKPPSVEDELRELKRRADDADAKYKAQQAKNEELEKKLAEAETKLGEEKTARQVAVRDAKQALNDAIADVRKDITPVGTVGMWWGDRAKIPAGWEICDGKPVETRDAVLTGTKPNFLDRYPKGVDRKTVADLAKGGNNNMPALKITIITGLKVTENGEHSHGVIGRTAHSAGPDGADDLVARGHKDRKHVHEKENTGNTTKDGKHSHGLTGYVGTEKGVNADGGDDTGANQPAFQEVLFIVRVK